MARITHSAFNLNGGVSQQPPGVRLSNQCREQVNAWSSVVDGLTKRHPTDHLAKIIDGAAGDTFFHTIDRDSDERYLVGANASGVSVWELDGTPVHVQDTTGGFGYLSGATKDDLDALTVVDFSFILNKKKTAAMSSALTPAAPHAGQAFFFIQAANYLTDYEISIGWDTGVSTFTAIRTCSTWDGTNSIGPVPASFGTGAIDSIKTEDIAEDLRVQIQGIGIPGLVATRVGSVVEIRATVPFTKFEITDSTGDVSTLRVHKTVTQITDLPTTCRHGFKCQITGDASSEVDDYFVEFVAEDGVFSEGRWEESTATSVEFQVDASTMPHQLVRRQDDGAGTVTGTPNAKYFSFETVSWADRAVGSPSRNPDPSFIGKTINHLFFYRNRLGLLSDENIVLSAAGDFFNFFRTTVLDLLADDLIDVGLSNTRVSILRYAVPAAENLVLFADNTQFILSGEPNLTPTTAAISPITEFQASRIMPPVFTGRSVYFGFNRQGFSGLRELFQVGDSEKFDAVDVTAQVPNYIQGGIRKLVASTTEDVAVAMADGDQKSLYVYKWFWDGERKRQSAWFRYEFGGNSKVVNIDFIGSTLYAVIERSGKTYLESITVGNAQKDTGSAYQTTVDRRVTDEQIKALSGVAPFAISPVLYDAIADTTRIQLPWDLEVGEEVQVVTKDGRILNILSTGIGAPDEVIVEGDHSTTPFWVGQTYTMRYEFSEPQLQDSNDTGTGAVATGRHQIIRGFLTAYNSRSFVVKVRQKHSREFSYVFTGPLIGIAEVGALELETQPFMFPVRALSRAVFVALENSSPFPSNISGVQWESRFNSRSSRFQG